MAQSLVGSARGAPGPLRDFIGEVARYSPVFADRLAALDAVLREAEAQGRATPSAMETFSLDLQALFPAAALAEEIRAVQSPRLSALLSWLDTLRNVGVLLPLAVTWLGLHVATTTYQTCVARPTDPDALARTPFLLLWERAFQSPGIDCWSPGVPLLGTFSNVLVIDLVLIGILATATAVIHYVSSIFASARERDARRLTAALRWQVAELERRRERLKPPSDIAGLSTIVSEQMRTFAEVFQAATDEITRSFGDRLEAVVASASTMLGQSASAASASARSVELAATATDRLTTHLDEFVSANENQVKAQARVADELGRVVRSMEAADGFQQVAGSVTAIERNLKIIEATDLEIARLVAGFATAIETAGAAAARAGSQLEAAVEPASAMRAQVESLRHEFSMIMDRASAGPHQHSRTRALLLMLSVVVVAQSVVVAFLLTR